MSTFCDVSSYKTLKSSHGKKCYSKDMISLCFGWIRVNYRCISNDITYIILQHIETLKTTSIWVIGENYRGEFGFDNRSRKTQLTRCNWSEDKNIIEIASRNGYTIYKSAYGKYYSFQFGKLKTNKYKPIQLKYFNDKELKIISAKKGRSHSIVLCDNGNVYTSGDSAYGALGHGNNVKKTEWKQIETLRDYKIIKVNIGGYFSLFVDDTGNVWTCGDNSYGQLGLGNYNDCYEPKKIKYFEENNIKIVCVTAGYYHTLAIDENGKIYSWGNDRSGQCGDDTKRDRKTPKIIKTLKEKKIIDIKCGDYHCCAITDQYEVYMWGQNYAYQCCCYGEHIRTPECINKFVSYRTNNGLILSVLLGGNSTQLLIDEGIKGIEKFDSNELDTDSDQ